MFALSITKMNTSILPALIVPSTFFSRCFSLLLCSLLFSWANAADTKGAQFTSPNGKVSFWAPVRPSVTVEDFPGKLGSKNKRTTYAMEGGNFLLLASELELIRGPDTTGDEESFLDSMLETLRNALGDKLVLDANNGSTLIQLAPNNLKGRELRGTVEGHRFIIRSFVGRRTIYTLQASYAVGDAPAAAMGEQFLDSLKVNVQPGKWLEPMGEK
jgi:hypothetical protein